MQFMSTVFLSSSVFLHPWICFWGTFCNIHQTWTNIFCLYYYSSKENSLWSGNFIRINFHINILWIYEFWGVPWLPDVAKYEDLQWSFVVTVNWLRYSCGITTHNTKCWYVTGHTCFKNGVFLKFLQWLCLSNKSISLTTWS